MYIYKYVYIYLQMQCIPLGLQNRDVVGIAQTGSGKTAAMSCIYDIHIFIICYTIYIHIQPEVKHALV